MGTDILKTIVDKKRIHVDRARREMSGPRLMERIQKKGRPHRLYKSLADRSDSNVHIIAEVKRASPSKGVIRADLDAKTYAMKYESGGASAISVLTDTPFFKGSIEDLKAVKQTVSIPVLRKDFIISSYQIYESAYIGADAVLLITRILTPDQIRNYIQLCDELGLDALVETHSEAEIETATRAGARLLGINNRNLNSFETSIETSVRLAGLLGADQTCIAESGIKSRQDIDRLRASGISNFLIGESLVRAPDPAVFLRELIEA